MGEANNCILDELKKLGSELPEIKEALADLEKVQVISHTTTFTFERSLAAAGQTAYKNRNDMEQLSKLVKESQSLYQIVAAAIDELETNIHQATKNPNSFENESMLKCLEENVEEQNKNVSKLDGFTEDILRLAPSFEITSNDFGDRLRELLSMTATQVNNKQTHLQTPVVTRSVSRVHHQENDVPNVLPNKMRWSNQVRGFPPRWGHAAMAVGNRVYSFGGYNGNSHPTYSRDGPLEAFILNVNEQEMEWKLLSVENKESNPSQRHCHSAVVYQEFVIIFGGEEAESFARSNTTFRFNTETLKWDAPEVTGIIPDARCVHSAAVMRNQMVVFGGSNNKIKLSNDLHSLDLDTFHWSTIAAKGTAPSFRCRHSATVHKDRFMFIFGGWDPEKEKRFNDLFCFDLITKEWTRPKTSGTTPQIREGHSAFTHNGLIFVFGGSDKQNIRLNDLYCYNAGTCDWKEVRPAGQPPSPRTNCGCVALNDRVFVFGGTDGKELDETFVLEIE